MSLLCLFCLSALAAGPVASAVPHPFSVQDMLAMNRITDPEVSPDGKWVAYTVRVTDFEANKGRKDLWLTSTDGTTTQRLTTHEADDMQPRWLPDSKSLVFLSTRSGSSQVWRLSISGGEATQLTELPLDVDNLRAFPDGKRLLFTLDVYSDAKTLDETARRDAEKEKSKVKARTYESLPVRHWDTWMDGKRTHVFAWSMQDKVAVDLMSGMEADAPPRPFGGSEDLAVSPSGDEVTFTARVLDRDAAWTTDLNLYSVDARGTSAPRLITGENLAADTSPTYSPDGKTLAYFAMQRPGFEADKNRIVLRDRASGKKRTLTESWDRSADELAWSSDGKTLFASAYHLGHHALFSIDIASGRAVPLVTRGHNTTVMLARGRLLFSRSTLVSPIELYSSALDGTDVKPVTKLNAPQLAQAKLGTFEQFTFAGAKGDKVHAYLVKPVGFDEKSGQKAPVAMLIHGGPQGSFGNSFSYRWNPQAFAGAGYAALFIDFHGSSGYGQAFTDAVSQDWGGAPVEDLMKGLDAALARYPYLDGNRVGAAGASFGGYMVNYLAGQTQRFRALVNHDGIFDHRMAYYETEELWFAEWEQGGLPWENPERFNRFNPVDAVKAWKTPMLVIHGGRDYRVTEDQGLATFTALQRQGIPSKLLYFPDENHWVLKPQNSALWHREVLGWLDTWVKPATVSPLAVNEP